MTPEARIEIACASDANYVPHAATMLASLFEANRAEELRINFLQAADIPANSLRSLQDFVEQHGATIRIIEPEVHLPGSISSGLERLTRAAWFRVLLPSLLGDVDRVLYLDVDLLVLRSVRPLWNTDLAGHAIAAVTDAYHIGNPVDPALGVPPGRYFNSGVLLMDLASLRRDHMSEVILDFALHQPDLIDKADQDPLNAVLHDRRSDLDPRWNVQPYHRDHAFAGDALREPAIVHFVGNRKPWQYGYDDLWRNLYIHYRSLTPWRRWGPEGRSWKRRAVDRLPKPLQRAATVAWGRLRP